MFDFIRSTTGTLVKGDRIRIGGTLSFEFTVEEVSDARIALPVQYLGATLVDQAVYLLPRMYKLTGTTVPIPGFFGASFFCLFCFFCPIYRPID